MGSGIRVTRHLFGSESKPLFCVMTGQQREEEERKAGNITPALFGFSISGSCGFALSLSSSPSLTSFPRL